MALVSKRRITGGPTTLTHIDPGIRMPKRTTYLNLWRVVFGYLLEQTQAIVGIDRVAKRGLEVERL